MRSCGKINRTKILFAIPTRKKQRAKLMFAVYLLGKDDLEISARVCKLPPVPLSSSSCFAWSFVAKSRPQLMEEAKDAKLNLQLFIDVYSSLFQPLKDSARFAGAVMGRENIPKRAEFLGNSSPE
jgi:hypothetical protein